MRTTQGSLIVIGGGGHALIVGEAARLSAWALEGFLDDHPTPRLGVGPGAAPRLGALRETDAIGERWWIVALGDATLRRELDELLDHRRLCATVIHPAAFVSPSAELAPGVFVGPGAVVHASAVVERHAIVNTGAIVEHDARVGRGVHIAPGAVLAGSVRVGDWALVGLGARVLPGVSIGQGSVVGAGAVVVSDVPPGSTVVGVPARPGSRSPL